jgi:glycosyltransferase involved in cell wall biosynthesis
MARARLFVLCSRFEGFPNAILEAMACGAPVVATASPSGIKEIVEHGVTGLLAPPDDPDALADAMRRMLADAPLRARCVENARRAVCESFTLESAVRRYERLLA